MKTTLSIIAAACLSGAAYGQQFDSNAWQRQEEARQEEFNRQLQERMREQQEWMAQRQAEAQAAQQHEQLEEIQAQQRQIQYEIFNRQLFQEQQCEPHHLNRWEREQYLRDYLEDCE